MIAGQADAAATGRTLTRLLASADTPPAASIVVPVNAQGDLGNVRLLLDDLACYSGRHRFEVILVVNNYDPAMPPADIDELRALGCRVIAVPVVARRAGDAIGLAARIPGARAAASEWLVLLDADCRVPDPTAMLDWYVEAGRGGAAAAYTRVGYHALRRRPSVLARMAAHHGARWFKRVVLRIPTLRGSNHAIRRDLFLSLYDRGFVADELNLGPSIRHFGGRIVYSGRRDHQVLTSGRMFRGGWSRLARYLRYRLRLNARMLAVRPDAATRTGRERDLPRRYLDDEPR